ncbi:MAG TPA: bifunctional phosphopantothenoylcysteine decarboxylase/phosphopantothenate--cysteine ligase CoaBC [Lachnospiraceae bacterium]|nr:bifunctional phosphopantothenoylcysteine decarboxylase/phosphopantothenate--cysteine ligase CoaBC [Lachnospiraceae bacterium]
MLKGKTVILGVTASIAAYKAAAFASLLVKQHADVHVLMTPKACNFIHPVTFETLTGNKCIMDTFDRNFEFQVGHVSLAKRADLAVIAPASADCIGRLACGIADDMLTTTMLACTCPRLVSPAMNTRMYENSIVQENLDRLERHGWQVIEPAAGRLACGDIGSGKMPEPETLLDWVLRGIALEKDMEGLRVLVTAGPTRESIDPVRFITNHSSGKMGYAIARNAMLRGAEVTLVSGPCAIVPVPFVKFVPVTTARDMYEAVTGRAAGQNIIVKAAAVADYRPVYVAKDKVKKSDGQMSIELERTDDILRYLGDHKDPGQFLCGFSMETRDMLENSRRKLREKHLDMIVANNVKVAGAGFAGDTNVITIITPEEELSLELMSKDQAAGVILDEVLKRRQR